ncbi:MAG: BlaI/MecI/CopY family transcriptional regulator [Candidatus Rokuibacteriota bacterium]
MKRRFEFIFRPFGKGLRTVLGALESDVMEVVWARGEVSVRDVQRRLEAKRPIAYTTVMTTLARLARKGLLSRRKVEGAYWYAPAVSREQLASAVAESVIDGLLEGFGPAAVSRLLDRVEREDPQRIDALARLIEKRRRRR